ncbi:hypothetical protein GCM10022206_44530 [Streptomyces chiangmaiensis]
MLPDAWGADLCVIGAPLTAGGGALAKEMIRVNHYGADATVEVVRASLAALGAALGGFGATVDIEAARQAATQAWGQAGTRRGGHGGMTGA